MGGTRLTETGLSIGTPQYMSPEQATIDRVLDARSDVYSLGAVVYEMLTGDPPHDGKTAQAIVAKVLSEPPSPIRQTRDTVPANVEAAVMKALAKTPADRFATASRFVDGLTDPAFARDATALAPSPGRVGRVLWALAFGAARSSRSGGGRGRQRPNRSYAPASSSPTTNASCLDSVVTLPYRLTGPAWSIGASPATVVCSRISGPSAIPAQRLFPARTGPTAGSSRPMAGPWSADGRFIVYREGDRAFGESTDLSYLDTQTGEHRPLLDTPFMERSPRLSPNGRWLAYVTNATGRDEVWVRAFPGPGGEWPVTTDGGAEPLWARDGEELFYRTATHLVAVEVETGSTFRMGRRTILFRTDAYQGQPNHTTYDVMPGDQTFAFVKYDAGREVVMVQNFFEEVKAKAGR